MDRTNQVGRDAVERLQEQNYSINLEGQQLYEYERQNKFVQAELPQPGRFDIDFLLKFIDEVDSSVKQTHEFKSIIKGYKLATSQFSKAVENEYLNNLSTEKRSQIFRDISRIFDQQQEAIGLKDKVRKIITYKLEDMRRNTRDSKRNLSLNLLQLIMNKNKGNRDIFDLMQKRILMPDVRQLIWRLALENKEISDEYSKKILKNRMQTMSRLDVQIIKDTEHILTEMTAQDTFDGSMIFAMKTVLSYYEMKQDRILTDYLYLICVPLIYVFGSQKHLLKVPTELIGYYYSLQSIVKFFDPLVDLVIKHDEQYDSQMTDLLMNSLNVLDEELANKFQTVLNLKSTSQRSLLVIIIKRFVHSLGFAFLPMDVTLFVMDQIVMKVVKNRLDIFVSMSIMCFCIRELLLECRTWDNMVDVFYTKGKQISMDTYYQYFMEVYKNVKFYVSPYEVDPNMVNRNTQLATDPLVDIIDQQHDDDVKAFKKQWFKGEEDDESRSYSVPQLPTKDKAIQDMKMGDALKNVEQKKRAPQTMGVVPVQDESEEDDIFAGMEGEDDD